MMPGDGKDRGKRRTITLKRLAWSGLAGGVVLVTLLFTVYRPWAATWGATEQEIGRRMAGDDIVPSPTFAATRAVTIDGRPEDIWPWIIQIGYKEAGFYSWDRLDNDGIPSTDTIIPDRQDLSVGDSIRLSQSFYAGVVHIDPHRLLLLVVDSDSEDPWTWAWGLYPLNDRQTRLVTRLRWRSDSRITNLTLDFFEIIMMRRHMLGIKRRVEAR